MERNLRILLATLFLVLCIWIVPSEALVIPGPTFTEDESGWGAFGLQILANVDVTLVSVRFPNQGQADLIELRRHSDGTLLTSVSTPAGQTDIVVNINYPLTAGETYRLVATTTNNKKFAFYSSFPTSNAEISVLASYEDRTDFWASFNDITTQIATGYDLYIKDNDADDGSVPSSIPYTESPDIWIRNDGDCAQTVSQDLIPGIMTTVCVRIHNRMSSDISNITANVYWADANQALSWPSSWAFIDNFTVTSLSGSTDTVGSVSWNVPRDIQQFGLLVRADASPQDPIGSGPDTTVPVDEVQNNNNIAQRNIEIIDPDSCIGQICYYSCTIGLCPTSWCTVYVPSLMGCTDIGQITYCGCTPPCPPSSCSVFIPQ